MLSHCAQAMGGQCGVVYSDPLIEQLGVGFTEGVALAASFMVDGDGIVRYVPSPDRVGEFLDPSLNFGHLDQPRATGQVA